MNKLSNSLKIKRLLEKSLLYCNQGQFSEAKIIYEELLRVVPNHPQVLTNLGTIEMQLGEIKKGILYLEKSIKFDPRQPKAISNLANGLMEMEKFEEAIQYYNHAIKLDSNFVDGYYNKARALKFIGKYTEAILNYQKAIKLNPQYSKAIINLGFLYNELKEYDKAVEQYNLALIIAPQNAEVLYNRAIVFQNLNKFEEALNNYNLAIELNPSFADALFNKATLDLSHDNYEHGWKLYESRWEAKKCLYIQTSKPELFNFSITQKNILIWSEQGIGDQILYSSLLQDAFETSNNFILWVDPRLVDLYKRSFKRFSNVSYISNTTVINEDSYDFHLPIGNLGKFFRNSLDDFKKHPLNYLKSNNKRSISLRKLIKRKEKLVCGIAWKSKNEKIGVDKSLSLQELLPILSLPNFNFVELQYGDTKEEKKSLYDEYGIEIKSIDQIDNYNDIDGLSSLIDSCDFVITSSNITAHLSGALGKNTYLLVPYNVGKIWYWHENRNKSLWYPSVNIYRQESNRSWNFPVENIISDLGVHYGRKN
jgi:Tfp pilus assembly protein PilF